MMMYKRDTSVDDLCWFVNSFDFEDSGYYAEETDTLLSLLGYNKPSFESMSKRSK